MERVPYCFDVTEAVEVQLVDVYSRCSRCHGWNPIRLEYTEAATVRNQPECPRCVERYGKEKAAL